MLLHQDTLLSEDVLEKQFICDLNKCKGACCIEGEFGAPITEEEITLLEKEMDYIKPFLDSNSLKVIDKKGIWEKDSEEDLVTTCRESGECVFAVYKNNILACGIEEAYKAGKTSFQKPISCHLYPIRISRVGNLDALNYHQWDICKPACKLGEKHQTPVFAFLKSALTRRYGEQWYAELEEIAKDYHTHKNKKPTRK